MRLKILISLLLGSMVVCLFADTLQFVPVAPQAAQIQANTTNSTAGAVIGLSSPQGYCRVYFSGSGVSATTGGNIIAEIASASGGNGITNAFDSTANMPSNTVLRLVITPDGTVGTYTASDTFNLYGVKYLKINRIMNQSGGPLSNIVVNVGVQSGSTSR